MALSVALTLIYHVPSARLDPGVNELVLDVMVVIPVEKVISWE